MALFRSTRSFVENPWHHRGSFNARSSHLVFTIGEITLECFPFGLVRMISRSRSSKLKSRRYAFSGLQGFGFGLTLRSTRTLSLRASVLKQLSSQVPQQ